MPISRHSKRVIWLGGLAIVLALLGHDAMMTSTVHALPAPEAAATAHEADGGVVTSGHHAPAQPKNCLVAAEAASYTGNPLDACDRGEPPTAVDADPPAVALRSVDAWTEPLWPPGTRRALFQVYRM